MCISNRLVITENGSWRTSAFTLVCFQGRHYSGGGGGRGRRGPCSMRRLWCHQTNRLDVRNICSIEVVYVIDTRQWGHSYFKIVDLSNKHFAPCAVTLNICLTSDHVWSDWKSDHELSTEVLIVRHEERATKRWLINDEIRWLKGKRTTFAIYFQFSKVEVVFRRRNWRPVVIRLPW